MCIANKDVIEKVYEYVLSTEHFINYTPLTCKKNIVYVSVSKIDQESNYQKLPRK